MAMDSTYQEMKFELRTTEKLLIRGLDSEAEIKQSEIDARLTKSMTDLSEGRVLSQDQLDDKMGERFARG